LKNSSANTERSSSSPQIQVMQVRMSEELIAVATETCDIAMDTKTVEKDIATVIKVTHLFFQVF
jgi:hypothetical protein